MKLLTTLIVLFLAALGLRLAIPRLGGSAAGGIVDQDGRQSLAACPSAANCHTDEWSVSGNPADAISTLAAIVSASSGTDIITQDTRYLHATYSTPLMGYVDDVEFLLADDGGSDQPRLLVRSASRLGKSDLGTNAKRLAALRSLAAGKL